MQKVALVLVVVDAAQQYRLAVAFAPAHVMPGRNQVGTQAQGVVEERLELDLAVAKDVRVGRAASLVFFQEVFEHIVPVLGREIGGMQLDTQPVTHGLRIGQVFLGGAVFGAVVLVPVLHEQAFNLIALFQQQGRRDGGVNAAGHADDNANFGVGRGGLGRHVSESDPVSSAVCSGSRECSRQPDGCAAGRYCRQSRPGSSSGHE